MKFGFLVILSILITINAYSQNNLRSADELAKDTSGWDLVKRDISIARNKFEILPANLDSAKEALYQTQVTAHSTMGAVIYLTGGILIDNGWIRVLGSGNAKLSRTLPHWNRGKTFKEYGEQPKFLLIADDAIGGFFAINGGSFGSDLGQVYYLAPDDLKWESLHINYTEFIDFCFVGDMNKFYDGLRWDDWLNDTKKLSGKEGFFIYPYLWTKEGKNIKSDSKKKVPIQELYDFETNALNSVTK